jgi:hypothetical protein
MTLDSHRSGWADRLGERALAAVIDVLLVTAVGIGVAVGAHLDVAFALAGAGLAYVSVSTVAFGGSLGSRCLAYRSLKRWKGATPSARGEWLFIERMRNVLTEDTRGSLGRGLARVAWNAVLLRIWFLR